jgi:hypothetical protein
MFNAVDLSDTCGNHIQAKISRLSPAFVFSFVLYVDLLGINSVVVNTIRFVRNSGIVVRWDVVKDHVNNLDYLRRNPIKLFFSWFW